MAKGALMGGLTALAVVVVAYTVVASKLDRWWITGAMVFVATGVILGPGGLDVLPFSLANETVLTITETITELTLALLLFSDASTVRLREVEGDVGLPRRLLFVGLPLTVIGGALVAHLMFPEVGWASAASTDTALGLAVVTNKAVPARIRRALNVESGLNDGIATPLVTLCIAVVAAEEETGETAWGSSSGPRPASAWPSLSSSPRPSAWRVRLWCGRSSGRGLLARCSPAASPLDPSSTPS
jgi:NhaP-type Na+/H+ or K+/H+ antiporter